MVAFSQKFVKYKNMECMECRMHGPQMIIDCKYFHKNYGVIFVICLFVPLSLLIIIKWPAIFVMVKHNTIKSVVKTHNEKEYENSYFIFSSPLLQNKWILISFFISKLDGISDKSYRIVSFNLKSNDSSLI